QGRTDNTWGPRAIGDHGAPVSLLKLKKAYEKGTRGISWGPLFLPLTLMIGHYSSHTDSNDGALFLPLTPNDGALFLPLTPV
ncbi:unnamed protein product, partial [Staurois parvus]